MPELKRYAITCLDADPEVRECTDGRFVLYTDAMNAIRQAREEALERAAQLMLEKARKMEASGNTPFASYHTELAADILSLKSEAPEE